MKLAKVKIIKTCIIKGDVKEAGEVLDLDPTLAREMINIKRAVKFEAPKKPTKKAATKKA